VRSWVHPTTIAYAHPVPPASLQLHEGSAADRWASLVWPVYRHVFDDLPDERTWRADLWDRHCARAGFRLATATLDGDLVGFAWGYTGQRGQWWSDQVDAALPDLAHLVGGHFELVELAVLPHARGTGSGTGLHDLLLRDLPHANALLSTSPDPDDAGHRLYTRRGWHVVGHLPWGAAVMHRPLTS